MSEENEKPRKVISSSATSLDRLHQQIDVPGRTIYLMGSIDEDENSIHTVWMGLCALRNADPEGEITILISSGGGDVEVGLAIYDLIKHCGMPTHICVVGYAHSMAIVILQAGDTRSAYPHASLMAHWGHQSAEDTNPENYRRKLKYQDSLDDKCDLIMVTRMKKKKKGMTMKKFKELTTLDWYMTPTEALKNGVIDYIEELDE